MRYIQKIYEDGRATAIPVKQITQVRLDEDLVKSIWAVIVLYEPASSLRMFEGKRRVDAFDVYINILNIIAEEGR